ncbi:hypothetical protein EHQ53_12265 [Leptospira langatensis]|uniref:Phage abortive infection protein n=1 Tax=Leptospira langatensis TaxID=2484983 RepID=A0A5F1ZUT9_9LEPT|nr:putative phage abortive infection protein [Leptospira langatensis]TGJ98685.1 hypothetical protein EHO57_14240 [Leptospira langatensis]TGL40749.1 hypothetical protein EHQ53_12265 [Leptospira langatensis]
MNEEKYQILTAQYERQIRTTKRTILFIVLLASIFLIPIFRNDEFELCFACNFPNYDILSKLGDYLSGTIAVLLNIAGLLLIYLSFIGQRQDILIQQYELQQNQKALFAQQKELAEQNTNTVRNRFESTFFNLINVISDLRNSYSKGQSSGPERFKSSSISMINYYRSRNLDVPTIAKYMKETDFYHTFQNYISHIMNIIDYVEGSNLQDEEKEFYIKTLRSLLPVHELLFIEVAMKTDLFIRSNSSLAKFLVKENGRHLEKWHE